MTRVAGLALFVLSLAVFGVAAERGASFVVGLVGTDKKQDARIDELEQQLRDLRAKVDAPKPPPREDDPDVVHRIPLGLSPATGAARDAAWVTVVAFLDYQCPFCERVQPTLDQLLAANPDVRLVVKQNPLAFHLNARPAAIAAVCAHARGSFWPAHRRLFEGQRDLPAAIAELDVDRACLTSTKAAGVVDADMALATREGSTGTPGFFVNGRKLMGAQPLEAFQRAVDRARDEAKGSGLPPARFYDERVADR